MPGSSGRPTGRAGGVGTLSAAALADLPRVAHTEFGEGQVLEVTGEQARIHFDSVGEKTLLITVAPLTLA